ncbi:tyrosine-type recombinase/integrase [Candidatus Borrarchaeum sp.]|uniref:tyrosine-type recombinase/integrase n=1 Tax=Candidatus Borrarchaeum sp. TaxID=2846742 RepID=UPI00257ACFB2|nr:tyrosine-type recombinase/integrase [Candidatus Borrarchaeum sp.]
MELLNDEVVERWLVRLKPSSVKVYRFHLKKFLQFFGITAQDFLEEARKTLTMDLKQKAIQEEKLRSKINIYYNDLKKNGKAYNTARMAERVIKAFLKYNGISLASERRRGSKRYHREPLRKDQIKKIVEMAPSLRDKLLVILSFQTGMGIRELLNLNIGDIEIRDEIGVVWYVRDRSEFNAVAIFGKDTIDLLNKYLDWRRIQAEKFNKKLPRLNAKRKAKGKKPLKEIKITDKSPLFTGIRYFEAQRRLVDRTAQNMLRETVVKAELITFKEFDEKYNNRFNPYGFHSLRGAFSSVAEQHGMPISQIKMSMGQTIEYNGAYKSFITEERIATYKKVEPYLSIYSDVEELEQKTLKHGATIEELKEAVKEKDEEIEELKKLVIELGGRVDYITTLMKERIPDLDEVLSPDGEFIG